MLRLFAFLSVFSVLGAWSVHAGDFKSGSLTIQQPWVRATPKGATVAGGYMAIKNEGTAADRLIGGSSTAAARFEVHSMSMEQGVMRMRPVTGGLEIKPGATVELKPGGLHVMLMDLKGPLEKGQRVKGTLVFEKAGTVPVEYSVEAIGGAPGGHAH